MFSSQGASASPVNENNMFTWTACIFGPDDTPWEGGIFNLVMQFSEKYELN